MTVYNEDIERVLNKTADLLAIKGDNPFRIRSYRQAAGTIASLSHQASQMINAGEDLSKLPGIGKDLAGKIEQICKTGTLDLLEDLKKKVPGELTLLMDVPGLGPKRVQTLYKQLNIRSLADLKQAAQQHKISTLAGFGGQVEQNVLDGISRLETQVDQGRVLLSSAEKTVEPLCEYLAKVPGVRRVARAGSYRRRRETVGDMDILVTCEKGSEVMERFVEYSEVVDVIAKGPTKSTVRLAGGLQVDVRVVAQDSYGAALMYFTGSKEHNVAVRKIGVSRGLKINEYGVFRENERIAGLSEQEVYEQVGLEYIEPELRENRGEIEAAAQGKLPALIEADDIRGDLHIHTDWSDGKSTIEQMARAGARIGYEYIGISDHSQSLHIAGGLKPDQLLEQIEQIGRVQKQLKGIRILKAAEVDILPDGKLDMPGRVLDKLDYRICSVHSQFQLSQEKQTQRVIKAMRDRRFNIMGHPTARRLGKRGPYAINLERVMAAARDYGIAMELNSYPERLDLNDIYCRLARQMGVKVVINTDAHNTKELGFMRYGLYQGRRGWLEAGDVLNAASLGQLMKTLKR